MVSVIIDNYNYGRFVTEAIESVLKQTYDDWELIVVDDGSKDDSIKIIKEYADKYPDRIRPVFKENGGQASCFNTGYSLAKGDIIAFLDSDDMWTPDKLERIAEAHKKSGYVAHEKEFSNGYRQIIHTEQGDKRSYYLREYGINDSYDIITSTFSLSRKIADRIFPMPEEEFRICADHYVKYFALYFENPLFLHEKLTLYRIHGDNGFVITKQKSGSAEVEAHLDYVCVEYINDILKASDTNAKLIPHKTWKRHNEFWKECGEGFCINPQERYVLYGTGDDSERFLKAIVELDGKLVAYSDSDEKKWGRIKNTKRILSPNQLIEERATYDKIIIASMFYYDKIAERLDEIGLMRGIDYMYTPVF